MKRTESILPLLTMLMLLGLVTFCAKAESIIRVHMIDARSGLPIANNPVRLWTRDAAEERKDPGYVQEMTNSNGVATFHVNDPIPSYLYPTGRTVAATAIIIGKKSPSSRGCVRFSGSPSAASRGGLSFRHFDAR